MLHLSQQAGEYLAVADAVGGRGRYPDIARLLVYGQMHLAPGAPLGGAVLTRLPLAVAEDLQARALYDKMQWLRRGRRAQSDGKPRLSAAEGAATRDGPFFVPSRATSKRSKPSVARRGRQWTLHNRRAQVMTQSV